MRLYIHSCCWVEASSSYQQRGYWMAPSAASHRVMPSHQDTATQLRSCRHPGCLLGHMQDCSPCCCTSHQGASVSLAQAGNCLLLGMHARMHWACAGLSRLSPASALAALWQLATGATPVVVLPLHASLRQDAPRLCWAQAGSIHPQAAIPMLRWLVPAVPAVPAVPGCCPALLPSSLPSRPACLAGRTVHYHSTCTSAMQQAPHTSASRHVTHQEPWQSGSCCAHGPLHVSTDITPRELQLAIRWQAVLTRWSAIMVPRIDARLLAGTSSH
jgi:hypothetical protein